jgi:hypothetical protein
MGNYYIAGSKLKSSRVIADMGVDENATQNLLDPFRNHQFGKLKSANMSKIDETDKSLEFNSSGDENLSPVAGFENANEARRNESFVRQASTCFNTLPAWAVSLLFKTILVVACLLPGLVEKIILKRDVVLVEFRIYFWYALL